MQEDSLPAEPQGKFKNTGVGSLSLLQRIFLTQESNQGLLLSRRILYQLSHKGSLHMLMGLGKKDKSYCQTSWLGPTGCPTAPSTARGRSCCQAPVGDYNVVLFPGAQSRGSHTGCDTQDPLPCTADPAATGPV